MFVIALTSLIILALLALLVIGLHRYQLSVAQHNADKHNPLPPLHNIKLNRELPDLPFDALGDQPVADNDAPGPSEPAADRSTAGGNADGNTGRSTEASTDNSPGESPATSVDENADESTEESTRESTEESTEVSTQESTEASTQASTQTSTEASTQERPADTAQILDAGNHSYTDTDKGSAVITDPRDTIEHITRPAEDEDTEITVSETAPPAAKTEPKDTKQLSAAAEAQTFSATETPSDSPVGRDRRGSEPESSEPSVDVEGWQEQIAELKKQDRFDEALQICRQEFPLWSAYQQASLIHRARIKKQLQANHDITDELTSLYHLAAEASFLHDRVRGLPNLSLAQLKLLDLSWVSGMDMPYRQIGYTELRLIKKTDIKLLLEKWGRPEAHIRPRELHAESWKKLCGGSQSTLF